MCSITTNHDTKESFGVGGLADFQPEAFGTASVPNKLGTNGLWDQPDWDEIQWPGEDLESPTTYNYPVANYGNSLSVKINMFAVDTTPKIYSIRFKYKLGRSI
jgi:hypothetical protein